MRQFWLTVGLAAIPLAWCASYDRADKIQPLVHLQEAVEVSRGEVWLSDLLPADAPSGIRKDSAAVELCAAPQAGNARVLDGNLITSKLAGQPGLLRQLVIPARTTVRNPGWPFEEATLRSAISDFLRKLGWAHDLPDEARIEWLRPLAASEAHPQLQATGVEWDNRQQSMQVRLRCSMRSACGSFLVHVVLAPALGEGWRIRLRLGMTQNSPGTGQAVGTGSGAVLAEKGKPAILVLEDGTMRITLRVICLQAGVLNQQIQVFDARSRHLFRAEVIGAALLRADL